MTRELKTCAKCGKAGQIADDETDPGHDELACDTLGVVEVNEYVCGECLDAAEDYLPCSHCLGDGTIDGEPCSYCEGTGDAGEE